MDVNLGAQDGFLCKVWDRSLWLHVVVCSVTVVEKDGSRFQTVIPFVSTPLQSMCLFIILIIVIVIISFYSFCSLVFVFI